MSATANTPDPLSALKPIVLPPEPSWWPPGPGWWLLAALVMALLGAGLWWWRRRRRARAPLVAALAQADALGAIDDPRQQVTALNRLLRQAALHRHGHQAAALSPTDWAEFLARHAPQDLRDRDWQQLARAPYQPTEPARSGEWLALGRAWLRQNLSC